MINLNMSDVVRVLQSCEPQLIALGIVAVLVILAAICCRKRSKALKHLIRSEAAVAFVLALTVVANVICVGPMSTLLSLVTGGSGTIPDEITEQTNEHTREIAREGIVLLENDGLLPLEDTTQVNVFGWPSVNPIYGGSGAGALNDLYPKTSLIEGLANAGFTVNDELTQFYSQYSLSRISSYGADWTLPEPPADTYSQEMLDNAKAFSDTAIVVLARWGGEGSDLPAGMTTVTYTNNSEAYADFEADQSYLELSKSERDMLDLVCSNFEHVVLVYNGLTTFEMGFIQDYPQIEGVLWCAGPGQTGFDALGEILSGEVNPSAKTPDTFLYDLQSAPWYNNFGNFIYDNMNEFQVDDSDPYMGGTVPTFVNLVENIYVGYRFYETAADEGVIDYDATVQYPFGYGLSYSTFTQSLENQVDNGDGTVSFDVTVTNTGDRAGKEVVEVYVNPPYQNGGIEKASVNLLAFDKTELLQPGESQNLSFTVDSEELASYDDRTNGCYVLEAGDYVISINSDSHHELASFTYTVPETIIYNESNPRSTDAVAAVNQFDDARGENVIYLSRADHFANLAQATAAPSSLSMPESDKSTFIWTYNYTMEEDPDAEVPAFGADNGITLAELRGKDYDDPTWESLLDQLTVDEMQDMIAHAGFQTAAAPSVGKIATVDCDGPSAVSNNFTQAGSVGFPSAVVIAATWNEDLALTYGNDMGKMADALGASGWYAPSANLHRSAFGGRAYEYFSEDPLICGKMAARALEGAAVEGVYGYMKHFAMNEQETNRWAMLCTWSSEQAIREMYLKPFEIAVKESHPTAVMSSFNYIGGRWAGGHKQLLTSVLRDEWGFEGMVETDYFAGAFCMNADQMLEAGGDCCLSTFDVGTNFVSDTTGATSLELMRRACHNIMYTVVNSRAYAGEVETGMETWMQVMIGIDVVIAIALLGAEVLLIKKYRKERYGQNV